MNILVILSECLVSGGGIKQCINQISVHPTALPPVKADWRQEGLSVIRGLLPIDSVISGNIAGAAADKIFGTAEPQHDRNKMRFISWYLKFTTDSILNRYIKMPSTPYESVKDQDQDGIDEQAYFRGITFRAKVRKFERKGSERLTVGPSKRGSYRVAHLGIISPLALSQRKGIRNHFALI